MRTLMLVVCALIGLGQARATIVSYSESITTSGSLGGTAFSNKLVTLTFTADTAGVTFFQGSGFTQYTNIPTSSTVTVAGIGTATFSDPISLSVFAFPTFSEFSVTDTSISTDILDTFAVASGFAGYNMQTSLSPVSAGASYSVGTTFATSLGLFDFTATGGGVSTVSAQEGPEVSSLLMMVLGLSSLGLYRQFRRRSAAGRNAGTMRGVGDVAQMDRAVAS